MNFIKTFLVNTFKSLNAVILIFLLLSFYLIQQGSIYAKVLGYVSMVWWSLIILVNIYKRFNKNS